jgi:hypothetical protein
MNRFKCHNNRLLLVNSKQWHPANYGGHGEANPGILSSAAGGYGKAPSRLVTRGVAADPAAGLAGSIGIFGKTAEGGDTVKETGGCPGGFGMGVFAPWTGRETVVFSSKGQSAKSMLAASACIIDHWHAAAIAEHDRFVKSATKYSIRTRPETSEKS